MAIHSHGHRKQILLFLVAVILPSLVLIAFTFRMISQERELAQKRMTDERSRLARDLGRHLLTRLEVVKAEEAAAAAGWTRLSDKRDYVNPEVVLIGLVDGNRLCLPWEGDREAESSLMLPGSSDFARDIRRAEDAEFCRRDFAIAAALYRQATRTATEGLQAGYAGLSLARVLAKANRKEEALEIYRAMVTPPSRVKDEYGVPLSLYAAGRLLDARSGFEEVGQHIRGELDGTWWLSPAESYLLRDLVEKLIATAPEAAVRNAAKDCRRMIEDYTRTLEQTLALRGDFHGLILPSNRGNQEGAPRWIAYGEPPWLLSLASPSAASQSLLLVVGAQDILASVRSERSLSEIFSGSLRLLTGAGAEGEFLGSNFVGLRIGFEEPPNEALTKQWGYHSVFYLLALLLVLGVTLFGAYLLWRDVRRDLTMAEMRSQFVSSVSHELKTPLAAIRMFAETLRLGRSKDQQMQMEYLDTIVNESERLTRLLNNVLDFSRIERDKRIYRPEPTSLYEIVRVSARAMEYPLKQHGFRLNVSAEANLPDLRVDRDALEQAILNLLHNAMKYSGDSRSIDLRLQRKDRHAVIQVIDQGVGIDAKEKDKIFQKFYRIRTHENELTAGTGLGLALVSHIVNAHGGHVEVESAPGRGSTFAIYLPLEGDE